VAASTWVQYRRLALLIKQAGQAARFSIPASAPAAAHLALDAITFAAWLDREGLSDPHLRWYLDYCCRDDYGAGLATVSASAGIHYFASRHGFQAPGAETADHSPLAGVASKSMPGTRRPKPSSAGTAIAASWCCRVSLRLA
jgi:hypothetical protein